MVRVSVSLYNNLLEEAFEGFLKTLKEIKVVPTPDEGEIFLFDKSGIINFDLRALSERGVKHLLVDTGIGEEELLFLVINFPISGVISPDTTKELLLKCFNAVLRGEKWFKRELLNLISGSKGSLKIDSLSDRELKVLSLLVEGKTNKEIARELGISEQTVKYYINQLLKKANCSNRVNLVSLFSRIIHYVNCR